ncbi:2-oxoglutarate dehydrogenase complex dihydrolipoyllysine-residue succinyltransferase [Aerophototrophica crusticola]|uniref:Dihydrolipoyllysine-residue succinyltransferase component of 2-oxoglutarate dehydrogenase complex n=1 Tax=Aerophototrophica crusticola TaxID=1709002 RepID=A0A858R8Z2_9PROT|nr:2-oxoglutarate dehydrogenase complex dihydrolipoyllysine-residue succinyltransferase [Rhodospirillaceae bacterium B3]
MATEIKVPTMGESVTEATVARWLKKVGDTVQADEVLLELETDKVNVEVNAPTAGTLTEIVADEGANVAVGALLGVIGEGAAAPAPKPAAAPAAAPAPAAPAPTPAPAAAAPAAGAGVMPAARKMAEDNKVDAASIAGTGKDGRVTKGDVIQHLETRPAAPAPAPAPRPAPASTGPRPRADQEERVKMTRLRQRIAERLKQAQDTAAMLTTFNEVDMTNVIAMRNQLKDAFEKKHGVKLGFMSFFVKAAIVALKELPAVNAEIDGTDLVYKNYYDIGVAVGTPQGLVVPVVRDADKLSFAGVEKTIGELGKKARDGKLSIDELSGGTFTISNGGVYGSLMSTPILNTPQSGILGMHKTMDRAVVVNGKVEVRPMMYLALSYDHRIIDGREAVTFLVRVKECIENPERILLDV